MRERALDLRAIAENPRETGDSTTAEALERRISAHVAMLTACSAEAVNATRACRPDPRGGMSLKSLERAQVKPVRAIFSHNGEMDGGGFP